MAFILYYYGGGELQHEDPRFDALGIVFRSPGVIEAVVWAALAVATLRCYQAVNHRYQDEFRKEFKECAEESEQILKLADAEARERHGPEVSKVSIRLFDYSEVMKSWILSWEASRLAGDGYSSLGVTGRELKPWEVRFLVTWVFLTTIMKRPSATANLSPFALLVIACWGPLYRVTAG